MSITNYPEFLELLHASQSAHAEAVACGFDFGTADKDNIAEGALLDYIDSIEQKIWIIMNRKNETVMMCPTEPTEEFLFKVATKISDSCTYRAFYLRPVEP